MAEVIFQEQDPYIFQYARHKELCADIQGGLMSCSDCGEIISASILSTIFFKSGKILSFQENNHSIIDQIHLLLQREVRYGSIYFLISHGKWLHFRKRFILGE
jgi:hypothetical protein